MTNLTDKIYNLRKALVANVSRKSDLMTDKGKWYINVGAEFASHHTTDHGAGEYVRDAAKLIRAVVIFHGPLSCPFWHHPRGLRTLAYSLRVPVRGIAAP